MDDEAKRTLHEIEENTRDTKRWLEDYRDHAKLRREVKSSERAHLLVSLGVLSGLISYYIQVDGVDLIDCICGLSGPGCTIILVAGLSVGYLPGKLLTTTLMPVADSPYLYKLNDQFLPSMHVFLFVSILPLAVLYVLRPGLRLPLFSIKYILVALLVSLPFAAKYAGRYQRKMEKVRTSSTRRNVIVTSSPGQDAKFRMTNPNDQPITKDEVKIRVDSPEEVNIDLFNTIESPEGDHLVPARDLEANDVYDIEVQIDPLAGHDDVSGEIDISIDLPNQPRERETIRYGVDESHSGATNIG